MSTRPKINQNSAALKRLDFVFLTFRAAVPFAGRGAPILRDNHKREERSAAKRLILSPLLRFSLRLSFLITPLSCFAPLSLFGWRHKAALYNVFLSSAAGTNRGMENQERGV